MKALENQLGGFRHSMMCTSWKKILYVCWHAAKLLLAALRITHSTFAPNPRLFTINTKDLKCSTGTVHRSKNGKWKQEDLSMLVYHKRMEQDVWRSTSIRQAGVSNVHDGHDGTMTGLSETSVAFSLFSYCIVFNGACFSSADLKSSCASVAMNTSATIKWR